MGGQWQQLAQIAANFGELTLSRAAIDLFVEAAENDPAAQYQKAVLLAYCGALDEAYALLCTLPDTAPDPAANAYSRGTSLLSLGRADQAQGLLERVTQLRPESGSAWLALALSVNLGREAELAERLVRAEPGMEAAGPSEQAAYYYALGKARADRGEHDPAFAAFARGAELQKTLIVYDREADRRNAEDATQGYTAEAIAAIGRQQQQPTHRSIFVTGLPRSGTTLVEQILTSHSAVSDGGEINRLDLLSQEVGGQSCETLERYVKEQGTLSLTELWNHLLAERFPKGGRIVDKTVNTSRHLGLAAAFFPEAPLIWVTRDPLDRAWSCFRTYFLGTMPWSYDLEDIAFHFRLDDQLLREWRSILGNRLLVVPYEELVTDPGDWVRRILSHCGLVEEPQVFAPHLSERAVATASVMQVRRPINREGIGSAEPYRAFLKPFIETYYA
jgi:tetratricopeptide (TPR) repeat protein